ncbi:MAG TPA: hypothetical protein VIF15_20655 [Polyangiaceae bacterium]
MKAIALLLVLVVAGAAACGSSEPAPKTPPSPAQSGATAPQGGDDAGRSLTKRECDSLAEWIVDVCQNRSNERSARVDGWCGEMIRGAGDGAWAADDCVKHFKYMDAACMRSSTVVHDLMACDSTVDRSR